MAHVLIVCSIQYMKVTPDCHGTLATPTSTGDTRAAHHPTSATPALHTRTCWQHAIQSPLTTTYYRPAHHVDDRYHVHTPRPYRCVTGTHITPLWDARLRPCLVAYNLPVVYISYILPVWCLHHVTLIELMNCAKLCANSHLRPLALGESPLHFDV